MITVTQGLSGKYFSASIPDVVITMTGYRLATVMSISTDGKTWKEIYSEHLFPVDGSIKIGDLSTLLMPFARQSLDLQLKIEMTEEFSDSDSTQKNTQSCEIVYCAAEIDTTCADFVDNYFLSILMGTKTTSIGRLEYLHYLSKDAATAYCTYSDGSQKSFPLTAIGGNANFTTIDVSPSQFIVAGKTLVSFYVTAGNRRQDYWIDQENPDCAPILIFVNSFGCEELLYCTGVLTKSPSIKYETAYVESKEKNIKITETRTFKADTGPMSAAEAEWFGELLRSDSIRVLTIKDGELKISKEVVITEQKSDQTNEDDEIFRFTFSYHYAQLNHNVVEMYREGRIFDNTFDYTFN